jgi:hypothetical protein
MLETSTLIEGGQPLGLGGGDARFVSKERKLSPARKHLVSSESISEGLAINRQ